MNTVTLPRWSCLLFGLCGLLTPVLAQEDIFDTLGEHLKFSAFGGKVALRFSGSADFEAYYLEKPAPGLIGAKNNYLLNPRLTLNLDAQIGPQVYAFVQARADRGYDPATGDAEVRADQYAVRYTPWEDGRINVQAGKFATVVGNWALRHDSWDNPFVTGPVPYENLTAVWDIAAADTAATLIGWNFSEKNLKLPIVWGASYTTGASIFGTLGKFDYALELKNASISSRPDSWSLTNVGFAHPNWSGRLGWRPDQAWNFGVSSSVGTYLIPGASGTELAGNGFDDYRQITVAQDISFAWHHWQFWAECFQTRFEIPLVGDADTLAYYIEAKYKFTPAFSAAVRWNQQFFNSIPDGAGGYTAWGSDLGRVDVAMTYRFTPHTQAKLQYSFLNQDDPSKEQQSLVAAQFTVKF